MGESKLINYLGEVVQEIEAGGKEKIDGTGDLPLMKNEVRQHIAKTKMSIWMHSIQSIPEIDS